MDVQISLSRRKDLGGEIYRQLRRAILSGHFRRGDRLPATRDLSRRLSVARTTVVEAYERLAAEGFVRSRVGSGTFVDAQLAQGAARHPAKPDGVLRAQRIWDAVPGPVSELATAPEYDFRTGIPDPALFPHERWRRLIRRATRSEPATYGHPAGFQGLREAIARHIAVSRGVAASADDVTVTTGTQQALDIVARVLLKRGDVVAVEDPGYSMPRSLFTSLGMEVRGVPVDEEGLVVSTLPGNARLVLVTPSHQYPLGTLMTLPRRLALLAWAGRHGAAIVEDDYDSEFRFGGRPLAPVQTLDAAGRVIYVGTFSKTLLPSLRLGFLVTPPSISKAVHKAKQVADWHTPMLGQRALAGLIEEGWFARHVRRALEVYRERHQTLVLALAELLPRHLEIVPSHAGLHVATLARRMTVPQILGVARRAAEAGVGVLPLSRFAVNAARPGLVLGYGAIPAAKIRAGVAQLKKCFNVSPG